MVTVLMHNQKHKSITSENQWRILLVQFTLFVHDTLYRRNEECYSFRENLNLYEFSVSSELMIFKKTIYPRVQ